jgi:hypothetical protein
VIDWYKFDWPTFAGLAQALATILVGVAVVIGAWRIGLRQTDILKNQIELERSKLAHNLYERRYRAYDASVALLANAVAGDRMRPSEEIEVKFMAALTEARFLYPREVIETMEEIWEKVQYHYSLARKSISAQSEGAENLKDYAHEALEINMWLDQRLITLHQAFPLLRLNDYINDL